MRNRPAKPPQPPLQPNTVSVRVPIAALSNSIDNGLSKRRRLRRFFRLRRRVTVEATPNQATDSVFFAPFPTPDSENNSRTNVTPSASRCAVGQGNGRPTPTEFLAAQCSPGRLDDLVCEGDDFEIAFVGMNVPPQDVLPYDYNELLLYSLRSRPLPDHDPEQEYHPASAHSMIHSAKRADIPCDTISEDEHNVHASHYPPSEPPSSNTAVSFPTFHPSPNVPRTLHQRPTHVYPPQSARHSAHTYMGHRRDTAPALDPSGTHLLSTDIPQIHYDPFLDTHNEGTRPDTFTPIPASKALLYQHRAPSTATPIDKGNNLSSRSATTVPVRFTVMEIDRVTSAQARAVASADAAAGYVRGVGAAVPFADLVAAAVGVANAVGKKALQKYARPDHVLSKDMEFRIAGPDMIEAGRDGVRGEDVARRARGQSATYLRYGYYFFLRDKVDAKLYARTDASSQNVPLLMRRHGYSSLMAARGEKEFFPLNGVSYVVLRVSAGISKYGGDRASAREEENRARLEYMLQMGNTLEMLSAMK